MKRIGTKRIISVMVVLVMLAAMLTACGGSKGTADTTTGQATPQPATTATEPVKEVAPEQVEITFLQCWNGGGGGFAQDQVNNPVAKVIREKTGVTVKMESITTSEVEKLNIMFASGTMPDFVNAPCWNTSGGEGAVIKKGAVEGQLLALDPYLDKYPNVKKLTEVGIAKDFYEFDLHNKEFNGKSYLIPQQTPDGTVESISNFAAGVYARGDILKALGVKSEDIDTSDKLFDLLVKIKNGGFKDINGKPVIPAGTMANGWDYKQFLTFWSDYNISSWRQENGRVISYMSSKDEEDKIMYMRKLIKNGLFDPEAFSSTDTMAKEKLTAGKLAVFGDHGQVDNLVPTLYKTNPEMKYELLGPFKNKSGKIVTQVEQKGRSGFPVMFISAQTKNPDAVFKFLDYVNSDEGLLLGYFGIEGTHYTMNNGRPTKTADYKAKCEADSKYGVNQGLGFISSYFVGAFSAGVKWPEPESEWTENTKIQRTYAAKVPVVIIDKVNAGYLSLDWPKLADYKKAVAQIDYDSELKKAYFAKTDEEALKLLNDVRGKLEAAGIQERADWIGQKAASRNDIGF